jgi:tripartite-type tricarboxylate transporter receptor subunit TctC
MRIRTSIRWLAAATALTATATWAQTWPNKPITFVMPYSAGGPTDLVTRKVAQRMSESIGQPILVVNAPGASTMIAAERVSRAPSDGYTLLVGSVTTFSNNPLMYKNIRYKIEDFVPISMMAHTPYTLSINPELPTKDFAQFVAYAKERPGKIFNATTGVGATNQLLGKIMGGEVGISFVDVPYKGSGPALLDVMGGQVHLLFDGINTSVPAHRTGKVRVLAVTSEKRSAALPDVPTFAELGYPKMTAAFWYGLFAPAGTPSAIVEKLNTELNAALNDKEIRSQLEGNGLTVDPGTPQALADTIKRDALAWGPVIKALGIQLE